MAKMTIKECFEENERIHKAWEQRVAAARKRQSFWQRLFGIYPGLDPLDRKGPPPQIPYDFS